jgi:hypothetical protein
MYLEPWASYNYKKLWPYLSIWLTRAWRRPEPSEAQLEEPKR